MSNVVTKAKQTWEKALSQIAVQTNNEKDKRIFYTAIYHAMQHPRLFSDVDGSYPKFAGNYELKKISGGNYYDDFSMWDIYRAQLPLLEILKPGLINQFVRSMILKGQQGGMATDISLLEQLYRCYDWRPCHSFYCFCL